jgi:hypothetical protein
MLDKKSPIPGPIIDKFRETEVSELSIKDYAL